MPAYQWLTCPYSHKSCAHLALSSETPSVPEKRVETNPMFLDTSKAGGLEVRISVSVVPPANAHTDRIGRLGRLL